MPPGNDDDRRLGHNDDDRRLGHRYPFFRTVHYAHEGRRHRGLMQNLSLGGVRMLCHGGVPVGQRLWVTLPGSFSKKLQEEPLQGEVVWSRSSAAGVRFVDVAAICAHGIDDVLSAYNEHASPAEVDLHQVLEQTALQRQPTGPFRPGSIPGRTLYVPRS